MRALAASVALHALVVCWFAFRDRASDTTPDTARPDTNGRVAEVSDPPLLTVDLIGTAAAERGGSFGGSGGGSSGAPGHVMSRNGARSHVSERERASNAWSDLSIHNDSGEVSGTGNGNGNGNGIGNGIGFGNGGGIAAARDVPAPPPAPKASRARPPKLIWPNRDVDVIDESYLFVAKVTIDRDGSVAGARMVTTRPGVRGEHAANAIWSFRYAPALDDDGNPIRATIEQPFQVR